MTERRAWGLGLHNTTQAGEALDTWYPAPALGPAPAGALASDDATRLSRLTGADEDRQVRTELIVTDIDLDAAPASAPDAYLRLHLLSHRLVEPNTINLESIFAVLPTIVWTSAGPCSPVGFEETRARLRHAQGHVTVLGVDKFPRMVDYVIPSGVRIGDADRIRLGAYLGEGTTVMHEGFVNFNAGTLGVSMVEGRISQGVTVLDGADIGGGSSTMGTLSGGGSVRITVGERSLLGANSGLGIPLGADCVVEAGLYLTAGAKVTLVGWQDERDGTVVKARDLAGSSGVLFRRNSLTGALEAAPRRVAGVELNPMLHQNN